MGRTRKEFWPWTSKGNLYGTTTNGGTSNAGTVFELKPPSSPGGAWEFIPLYSFAGTPDGSNPYAGVTVGHRALYGTTQAGGAFGEGSVFQLSQPAVQGGAWKETVIYSFIDLSLNADIGVSPYGGLILDASGALYGTTFSGGDLGCECGGIFKLTPSAAGPPWTESAVYKPTQTGSGSYRSNLVFGPNGSLYGVGGNGAGAPVFQLIPPAGGEGPWNLNFSVPLRNADFGGLVLDASGTLYGAATSYVFSLKP